MMCFLSTITSSVSSTTISYKFLSTAALTQVFASASKLLSTLCVPHSLARSMAFLSSTCPYSTLSMNSNSMQRIISSSHLTTSFSNRLNPSMEFSHIVGALRETDKQIPIKIKSSSANCLCESMVSK